MTTREPTLEIMVVMKSGQVLQGWVHVPGDAEMEEDFGSPPDSMMHGNDPMARVCVRWHYGKRRGYNTFLFDKAMARVVGAFADKDVSAMYRTDAGTRVTADTEAFAKLLGGGG